jgi:chitinase
LQCPFPDAYLGDVLNAVEFDMVHVQFCASPMLPTHPTFRSRRAHADNNFCGVQNFANPNVRPTFPSHARRRRWPPAQAWNYAAWDTWARTQSPNKDVRIFVGVPASASAAGSGYVAPAALADIVQQTRAQYASFGGVMYWDASQAYGKCLHGVQGQGLMARSEWSVW